jgi:CHASE2 domain-containing sensor protein
MIANESALWVFIAAFAASATAGIAAYLRSNKPITILAIITAALNSGLLGLAIALLWFKKFQDNIYFLVGVCVVTGLTGAAGLDFILTAIQKGGLHIKFDDTNPMNFSINNNKEEDKSEKS